MASRGVHFESSFLSWDYQYLHGMSIYRVFSFQHSFRGGLVQLNVQGLVRLPAHAASSFMEP